ncbi:DUF1758 domain-containing protein [Trichonephila inaurata madagascariensis]|uniref:DUF1758 domain-containing protein n=1 Tax=Trichonephila inaurata madagascariensis TaxID=2747483 RepID=A0A8X6X5B8_9ARAC|nr:DUF1758 domain-containing protein [Trichonephila inaurata madagascariensis]
MLGALSNKEAIILIQALIEALDARGFHLRKRRSNSRDVLINVSKNLEFKEPNVEIHHENCSKAYGYSNDWDDALPEHFVLKWKKFQMEFQQACLLSILRWLQITNKQVTLHGFSDASEAACACVVLSRVSSPPRNWKPFVANRTSEILDIIPCKKWRHVPSKENPADLGSRGISPKDLPNCSHWWKDLNVEEEIKSPPETVEESKLTLKGCWDIVQKLKLHFWRRWQIDYLNSMQGRTKWKSGTSNIKIGDVVIIKEDNLLSSMWPLGKVISTHPGKDGIVRVVTLKTTKGLYQRPIVKLSILPVHQE